MARVRLIKRIAALVLLASFFLPLSQCDLVDQSGKPAEPLELSGFSAYKWPSVGSTIAAAIFAWPALLQLLALRIPNLELSRWIFVLEVSLSILTISGIFWLAFYVTFTTSVRYGAFVAWTAMFTYLVGAIAGRYVGRHSNSTAEPGTRESRARGFP